MSKNLPYRADLHVHTKRSDGSGTVEEILEQAERLKLSHIVFTDHDTTQGAREAAALAVSRGFGSAVGVEISAMDPKSGKRVHILGYDYRTVSHIEALCRATLINRDENCVRQIRILQGEGFRIDEEEVRKISGRWMYKVHLLDYLVRTGQSDSLFGQVYQTVFRNGGPCDFDIEYVDAADAVRAVCQDGGLAVLAHPGQQKNLYLAESLAGEGLAGVEYDHPSHGQEDREAVLQTCRKYRLFPTGGSDYHGRYENRTLGAHLAPDSSRIIFEREGRDFF